MEDIWEGDQSSAHSEEGGMKNKEHFKRRTMEFLLKSWSGDQNIYINLRGEKSVGTTELHYSTKKRKHSFGILKAFFVRHSSEYETSDNDRKVNRNI